MKHITVGIPSYGYGHLVAQAIDSVLSQTKQPDRIIVVDDGAHDGACDVAIKYGVEYIEKEVNTGVVDTFNMIQREASEGYLLMLGADNWLRPDALELMMDEVEKNNADIVSSDMYITGSDAKSARASKKNEYINGYWIWRMKSDHGKINRSNFIHGSSLYNVELALKVGGYQVNPKRKEDRRKEEDWMLWKKMILKGGAKHIHVPEPLLYYRRHGFNFNGNY
jgi:glycosyltransferase involved in cell wall biosynthesis